TFLQSTIIVRNEGVQADKEASAVVHKTWTGYPDSSHRLMCGSGHDTVQLLWQLVNGSRKDLTQSGDSVVWAVEAESIDGVAVGGSKPRTAATMSSTSAAHSKTSTPI